MTYFPEEVLEHIFSFLGSHRDRNAVSLVCKDWYHVERLSRRNVFIGNCYSVSPCLATGRFPRMKSLTIKGKPHFADFNLVPIGWGGDAWPWIEAASRSCRGLEELRLKRMVVTDECLELLARSFPYFRSLVLVSCEGFSTDGLASIAANCRYLSELDLQENEVEDHGSHWLNCFPSSTTSLVSLNFACLKGDVNPGILERLVARSPKLKSLRLNRGVSMETLSKILSKASQLVDLGTGSYALDRHSDGYSKLVDAISKCKSLRCLSGFWDASACCLPAVYPICGNLTSLNLSYAPEIESSEIMKLLSRTPKLQRLWVLDCIGDEGLRVVASTCKELRELRVFPSDIYGAGDSAVTEQGLVSISIGCPKLHSILYFCHQMTNEALITVAKNNPRFIRFRLALLDPKKPDAFTYQPLDEGFGAIVKSCKELRRLSLSGLLTDRVFFYIGMHAKRLEMLSIAFAGDSDKGMIYVLKGCKNLRKLEIRDCPFGDSALLKDVEKYETMRSLWMSSCDVTLGGCKALAENMPSLNVEVIHEKDDEMEEKNHGEFQRVEKLYVYRTIAGPRRDAPDFVWTL